MYDKVYSSATKQVYAYPYFQLHYNVQ